MPLRTPRSTLFPYNDALPILGFNMNRSVRLFRPVLSEKMMEINYPPGIKVTPAIGGIAYAGPEIYQWTAEVGQHNSRSEEHTSELQSPYDLVCRLLLEKKKKQ